MLAEFYSISSKFPELMTLLSSDKFENSQTEWFNIIKNNLLNIVNQMKSWE